ncbi:MAG: hypothetical protein ACD_15C00204G0020 [uncultured bacterium]|nr:MAG: hypothetical protein ACD_15C00204G0020 [uncultured bacterium]
MGVDKYSKPSIIFLKIWYNNIKRDYILKN